MKSELYIVVTSFSVFSEVNEIYFPVIFVVICYLDYINDPLIKHYLLKQKNFLIFFLSCVS